MSCTSHLVDDLAVDASNFHGTKDYLDAARDPSASVEDLSALARSDYVFVAIAVGEHASDRRTSSTLGLLRNDRSDRVRRAAARPSM